MPPTTFFGQVPRNVSPGTIGPDAFKLRLLRLLSSCFDEIGNNAYSTLSYSSSRLEFQVAMRTPFRRTIPAFSGGVLYYCGGKYSYLETPFSSERNVGTGSGSEQVD